MDNDKQELPTILRPGDPGYEEAQKDLVNIPGNKPMTLAVLLRFIESDLHSWKKRKQSGRAYTLPSLAQGDNEPDEPQSLDELIEHWEKEKAELEKVIAWAEANRPGSSRKENGSLLMQEYEDSLKNA